MKTQAAVLVELGRPLDILDLDIPPLRDGQALVEIAFSGVCHTQLLECRGRRGRDPYLPHCLGHEGAGVVREVGRGVTKVQPGDSVVLSWIKGRGGDVPGTVYASPRGAVNAGGVTTFMRHAVVSENRLNVIAPRSLDAQAALLGCAAPTGVGAVWNTAAARADQSVVVFGCGAIGLCAVAAAAAGGCGPVIAVDPLEARRSVAKQMGADHLLDPTQCDPVAAIADIARGGCYVAIEATGRPDVMRQALACVRPRGGAAVVIGNAPHDQSLTIDPQQLNMGKRLLGTWGGDWQPDRDYPRLNALLASGTIDLTPLLGATYTLERINDAIDDLEAGRAVRPIIDMRPNAERDQAADALATRTRRALAPA